ncbi:hypothetical protein [Candidatus Liberibacter sp.]|uniref:hypothetical protein n=1 Tax=Candidatus Liberibacter sp. TaxID=34022 RepID=UPI0015F3E9B0|nr:hypothetical protein [Candidatus Liberibacter sp.]MBA5723567.1 hypothetical protein [Candidatus Liberibacter sp.]
MVHTRTSISKSRMALVTEDREVRRCRRYWDGEHQRSLGISVEDSSLNEKKSALVFSLVVMVAFFVGVLISLLGLV